MDPWFKSFSIHPLPGEGGREVLTWPGKVAPSTLTHSLRRLANPITAIIVSVTAVLFFGEIIPQSICTRYGLAIGARMAVFVRLLMAVCSPIAWPVGKLLDKLLGADHHSMFRRKQVGYRVEKGTGKAQDNRPRQQSSHAVPPCGPSMQSSHASHPCGPPLHAVLHSFHAVLPCKPPMQATHAVLPCGPLICIAQGMPDASALPSCSRA